MPPFDPIIQTAVEKLYEDERLRSNLTDRESKIVLDWAEHWVIEQVNAARDETAARQIAQNELTRVRQAATALNALAAQDATPRLADALAAIDSGAQASAAMTREEVLALATTLASALWTLRARGARTGK